MFLSDGITPWVFVENLKDQRIYCNPSKESFNPIKPKFPSKGYISKNNI